MPVIPVFAAIGSFATAGAATGAAAAVIGGATVASAGAAVYSMEQNRLSAKASASLAEGTANFNARVNEAEATQVELDTAENVRRMREEARIYSSRQEAAYAVSGVQMSGSPLAVMAMSAGRLEQQAQQEQLNAKREAEKMRVAGRVGVLYGAAQASGIRQQSQADTLRGGASILSTIAGAYQSGVFSVAKGTAA